MTVTYKCLGQAAPNATTETTLYTVPASTSAVSSSVSVCNRSGVATTFRVSVSVGGGATANKDYLYYDLPLNGNDTFTATVGLTLAAGDIVRCYAGTANVSFAIWGTQIT